MPASFAPNAQRRRAKAATPNFIELLRQWGGVTIAYRRRLIDAPSYTLNHEEVAKALEEGISFAERLTPEEALLDRYGCVRGADASRSLAEADSNPGAPPRDLVLPGAHHPGGGRHAAQHGARPRRSGRTSSSTASSSRRSTKTASR